MKRIADMNTYDIFEVLGFKIRLTGIMHYGRHKGLAISTSSGKPLLNSYWFFNGNEEFEIIGRIGADGKAEMLK